MARVLIVFQPSDGGVAEYAEQLAVRLGHYGHETEIAGPPQAAPYHRLAAAGIPIHRLPLEYGLGGHALHDAAALREIVRLCRRRRFGLVHCLSARAGVLGRLATLFVRVPIVYSPHCYTFVGDMSPMRRRVGVLIERSLAHLTAITVCSCEDERAIALSRRIAPYERLAMVHNGSPARDPSVLPDPELAAMRAGGPLAVAVVSLRAQKTVDVLIDAVPLVLARIPEARIAVVGNGPLREALAAQAGALGLDRDERFRLAPFKSPSTRYLLAADVYVLPSAWEGFPFGPLEAMACGVPQVATDVGGTREAVVAETGVLVPPHDPQALADALVELLGDEQRRMRMAEASRARHAAHFGLDRMLEETAAVYGGVLARASRA